MPEFIGTEGPFQLYQREDGSVVRIPTEVVRRRFGSLSPNEPGRIASEPLPQRRPIFTPVEPRRPIGPAIQEAALPGEALVDKELDAALGFSPRAAVDREVDAMFAEREGQAIADARNAERQVDDVSHLVRREVDAAFEGTEALRNQTLLDAVDKRVDKVVGQQLSDLFDRNPVPGVGAPADDDLRGKRKPLTEDEDILSGA